jgi:hypothetical protein
MAEGHELQPRPVSLLIASGMPALFTLYAAVRTGDLMASHRKMLEGLGAEIPPLTGFVLNGPNLWWVMSVPAVLVFIWVALNARVTRKQKARMKWATAAVYVFGVALYGFVLFALQGPIRALSSAP